MSASPVIEVAATAASAAVAVAEGTGNSSSGPSAAAVVAVAAAAVDATGIVATAAGDASRPDSTPWPSGQVFPIYFTRSSRGSHPFGGMEFLDRPGLAASRRPPVLKSLRRLINSLGLPGLEPAVVEGPGVFLGDLDVKQVQLRFHEVAELLPLRLVLLIPHARELLVLEIFDHRWHRLETEREHGRNARWPIGSSGRGGRQERGEPRS